MRYQKPRYEQIAEFIQARIMSGELKPRRRIPSHHQMAKEFDVSASTVFRAVASLRERNYLWTLPYKGSYVRPSEDWRKEAQ